MASTSTISPFLYPGGVSKTEKLAIVHLKRDLQLPTILKEHDEDDEGYSEGKVVNTRFGSFPHSTLIGLQWGAQVRASIVDTGSRGRRVKKRKRGEFEAEVGENTKKIVRLEGDDGEGDGEANIDILDTPKEEKEAVAAASGFIHLLPPTPENWTSSLPHRTQVVYTPDYSYILHRIRARPGTNIIEAGAGSGSFTHASARAVFRGYPGAGADGSVKSKRLGKVWSFEFHEQRHGKLQQEIQDHGLEGIVQITHRDVCEEGFLVDDKSPGADAIFLDLPAPWLALPHLVRSKPTKPTCGPSEEVSSNDEAETSTPKPFVSPLNPSAPIHICTFSPCIEQVQRTVSVMRKLGWVDIETVELSQKRFEVRRDRIGIDNGQQRGLQTTPANVNESVSRLLEVEGTFKSFHENGEKAEVKKRDKMNPNNREKILESLVDRKIYKEGNLVHRTEPEVRTHTSYLVFAILPQEWTAEDEEKARAKWDIKIRTDEEEPMNGEVASISKRQMKKAARQAQRDTAATGMTEQDSSAKEGGKEGYGAKIEVTPDANEESKEEDAVNED